MPELTPERLTEIRTWNEECKNRGARTTPARVDALLAHIEHQERVISLLLDNLAGEQCPSDSKRCPAKDQYHPTPDDCRKCWAEHANTEAAKEAKG
jgi:hypothetical protein